MNSPSEMRLYDRPQGGILNGKRGRSHPKSTVKDQFIANLL